MRVNYQRIRARRKHAKLRAEQRYGLCLTTADLSAIVDAIRGSRAIARQRLSKNASIQIVDHEGMHVAVLYSHRHHEIITCLPLTDRRVAQLIEGIVADNREGAALCV